MRNWIVKSVIFACIAWGPPAFALTPGVATTVNVDALGSCSGVARVQENKAGDALVYGEAAIQSGGGVSRQLAVDDGEFLAGYRVLSTAAQIATFINERCELNSNLSEESVEVINPGKTIGESKGFGIFVKIGDQTAEISVGAPDFALKDDGDGDGDGGTDTATVRLSIMADANRQLTSQISSNQRLVREGRTRFIQSRRQMAGGGSGLASRNVVDFDVDGAFNVDNGRISTQGTFFEQAGNYEGTSRRIFFGDFDVQHDSDTNSTTASLSGKVAWERMLDDQNMLGYFVGADLAYSDIRGLYKGDQSSYGVSVGAYYVSALRDNLFVDTFISLGAGQNDLKLSNGILNLKGDYESYTATVGAALTGVIERKGYEIWPEIALTYGYTDLGTIGMTDRNATTLNNRVIVDAGSVSIANLTIRPEFRVPTDGRAAADSLSLFTFAPRFICEQVDAVRTTEDCGAGAEIGLDRTSKDGESRFIARIKADRIASSTRTGLELKLEHQF